MKLKYSLAAAVVLVALIVVALVIFREPAAEQMDASFPDISKDQITKIWIRNPVVQEGSEGDQNAEPVFEEVTLERTGKGEQATWKLTSPVQYPAYASYVDTMLTRLTELELGDMAVESKANWAALEVDEAKAVHVKVFTGNSQAAEFFLGIYKAGNTMVRLPGDDRVFKMQGSIRYVFGKRTMDWRDKTVLDQKAEHVTAITYRNAERTLSFTREGTDWAQVLAEGEEPMENFDPKKVGSLIGAAVRLRTADFADGVDLAEAGLAPPPAEIEFTVSTPGEPEDPEKAAADGSTEPSEVPEVTVETFRIILGKAKDDKHTYLMVEGNDQVFLVTTNVIERLDPGADKFVTAPKPEGEAVPAGPPMGMGGMGGMPISPPGQAGGGQGIPPEVMKQVQAEIQKQKMMKKLQEKLGKQ
jgi:hypothetical protein